MAALAAALVLVSGEPFAPGFFDAHLALGIGTGESHPRDERALVRIYQLHLGLPPVPVPGDNPPTAAKVSLGRKLFFDRRLSFNNTMSCGMCHIPEQGFTNNELATPIGVEGKSLARNAPTIINAVFLENLFHDGRESSLENQTLGPLLRQDEMANPSIGLVLQRLGNLDDYDGLFERAFGGGPSAERIGMAIASWERTLVAGDSPFDRWQYGGVDDALTDEQKRGLGLFTGRAGCTGCHTIGERHALFTDHKFHDTGIGYIDFENRADDRPVEVEISAGVVIPVDREVVRSVGNERVPDLGRFAVTLDAADKWRFRTPTLRNVALTAPYMHDGSLRTLEDVVRFYNGGGVPHPGLDPLVQPLSLTGEEIAALVAFLRSLKSGGIDSLVQDARNAPVGN